MNNIENMSQEDIDKEISEINEDSKKKEQRLAVLEILKKTGAVVGDTIVNEDGSEFVIEKIILHSFGPGLVGKITKYNAEISSGDWQGWSKQVD